MFDHSPITLSSSDLFESAHETDGGIFEGSSPSRTVVLTSESQPIPKSKDGCDFSHQYDTHSHTQLSINLYPVQELGPVVDDSDAISCDLRKYMEGDNIDLLGISELLSSPDNSLRPDLQCAALQLLEHAAEWQSANFAQCTRNILDPVAKLVVDSSNFQVRYAALDTLKLFMGFPRCVAESKILHDVVNTISDDLKSSDPLFQLASVELLEAASRSEEILARFSTAVSCLPSTLPSMPLTTQVTALKVIEVGAGSNARGLVKAVADTFHYLIEPLSSPEAALQIAALKVLEAATGTQDNQLASAVKIILPVISDIQSSGKINCDIHNVAKDPLAVCMTPVHAHSTVMSALNSSDAPGKSSIINRNVPRIESPTVTLHQSATVSSLSVSGPLNVLIFGETGVGKSSVINLILGKEQAQTSADAPTCTLDDTPYEVTLGDRHFRFWEVSSIAPMIFFRRFYAKWNLKRKFKKLFKGDGVHLLLYCMRSSRAQGTMIKDYKIFTKIVSPIAGRTPVAAVVTCLEDYPSDMDDWWTQNEDNLRKSGIEFSRHACITALPDDPFASSILRSRQQWSRKIIRELICGFCQPGGAPA